MRPKAAFHLSPLHNLIALIILCNSCCFLCLHFYRHAVNAMVWLWLWNLGTAHVVSIKSSVFLYQAHGRLTDSLCPFSESQAGNTHRRLNEREWGDYKAFLRTFSAAPRINTLFSWGAQPARVIQADHWHMIRIKTNPEQPGNNMTSAQ